MLLEQFLTTLEPRERGAAAKSIRVGGSWWWQFSEWAGKQAGVIQCHKCQRLTVFMDSAGFFHAKFNYQVALGIPPVEMAQVFGSIPGDGARFAGSFAALREWGVNKYVHALETEEGAAREFMRALLACDGAAIADKAQWIEWANVPLFKGVQWK